MDPLLTYPSPPCTYKRQKIIKKTKATLNSTMWEFILGVRTIDFEVFKPDIAPWSIYCPLVNYMSSSILVELFSSNYLEGLVVSIDHLETQQTP